MPLDFEAEVCVGGGSGSGFVELPLDSEYSIGDSLKVFIPSAKSHNYFFANIISRYSLIGIYVPKRIVKKHKLLGKRTRFSLDKIEGFHSRANSDGRIYIPIELARQLSLRKDDIVKVDIISGSPLVEDYSILHNRKKKNTEEFFCKLNHELNGNELFKIEKLNSSSSCSRIIRNITKQLPHASLNGHEIIIFKKNHQPVTITSQLDLSDFACYLGAYFADGIKKGFSWGICASTFEQANFYFRSHNRLIKNADISFSLTYTVDNSAENYARFNKVLDVWGKNLEFQLPEIKPRIINNSALGQLKRNPFGTLVFKEHKMLLLDLYNSLLAEIIREIVNGKKRRLGLDFILGVLEGDGTVNAKKRGHIQIATNSNQYPVLEKILDSLKIRYRTHKDGKHKVTIRIGALEVLRILPEINDKVFQLYPKRRKALIERLFSVGGIRYLCGKQNHVSSWVKAHFKKEGLLNKKYDALTKKGKKIKSILLSLEKELHT